MAKSKLENEYRKYWKAKPREWHENKIGIYHVSSIGCNHQDLDPDNHSGPCLRSTYWDYVDPIPNSDETDGNLEEGNRHHKDLQKIIKEWKPNSIIEYPVAVELIRELDELGEDGELQEEKILFVGSIDILYKHLFDDEINYNVKSWSIWDIKTASSYTLPRGKYDKNPTHFDQTEIYGYIVLAFDLDEHKNKIKRKKIIYIDKHNLGTYTQREKFNVIEAEEKYQDAVERCWYIHDCLTKGEVPAPEPMHWCKYCKYLDRCMEQGDVEAIQGRGGYIKKLVVV